MASLDEQVVPSEEESASSVGLGVKGWNADGSLESFPSH